MRHSRPTVEPMCYDADATPPVPDRPVTTVEAEPITLTGADGARFAAYSARARTTRPAPAYSCCRTTRAVRVLRATRRPPRRTGTPGGRDRLLRTERRHGVPFARRSSPPSSPAPSWPCGALRFLRRVRRGTL